MARQRIPSEIERRVRAAAGDRCGYCLSPQHLVMARLEIEHIIPLAQGGTDDESNLWLACPLCNSHKSDKIDALDAESNTRVPLFNPRTQVWFEHFQWAEDGIHILGKTAIGQATIGALHLSDDPDALIVRSYWVMAGWHPPKPSDLESK
jgi:hypothetical protein